MPRMITQASAPAVDGQPRRFSALVRWRLVLAGAGVAIGLAFGSTAWAGSCTAGPPNMSLPASEGFMQCNCDTASANNNVWNCSGATGTYTCVLYQGKYECWQSSVRGPGGGKAPTGSGGGGGTAPAGGSVPGKKMPGTAK